MEYADQFSFEKIISENKLCLVDFFASWCGPCQLLGPELEKIEKNSLGLKIVKIDVDNNYELASSFNINAVPTMIVFKEGKPVTKLQGYMTGAQILKAVEKIL